MWESTGRRAASHAATTVPRTRESMDVWIVACGLSFPRNLSPPFVIGEREARADAMHVYGVSSVIPPSSVIFPSSVILSEGPALSFEGKNLASRLPGHDAGGVGQRIACGHVFPSPRPSPARGEGERRDRGGRGLSRHGEFPFRHSRARGNPGASIRLPGGVRRSFPRMWESTGRRAASHAATTVPRARESMDVWLVACGLSFPRNLSPPFVIGERESRADAVHVYGVSSVIPPSSVIFPSSVILSEGPALSFEGKNLASRLPGHDAGGVGQRVACGHFFPSPRPSPSRGEGGGWGSGEEGGFPAMVNPLSVILAPAGIQGLRFGCLAVCVGHSHACGDPPVVGRHLMPPPLSRACENPWTYG